MANIYFETRGRGATVGGVPDTGRKGLSNRHEVVGIVFSILKDYAMGTTRDHSGRKISMTYRLASQRLRLLRDAVLPRDHYFRGSELRRAKHVVSEGLRVLRRYKDQRARLISDLPKVLRRLEKVAERGRA